MLQLREQLLGWWIISPLGRKNKLIGQSIQTLPCHSDSLSEWQLNVNFSNFSQGKPWIIALITSYILSGQKPIMICGNSSKLSSLLLHTYRQKTLPDWGLYYLHTQYTLREGLSSPSFSHIGYLRWVACCSPGMHPLPPGDPLPYYMPSHIQSLQTAAQHALSQMPIKDILWVRCSFTSTSNWRKAEQSSCECTSYISCSYFLPISLTQLIINFISEAWVILSNFGLPTELISFPSTPLSKSLIITKNIRPNGETSRLLTWYSRLMRKHW